jgi:hypothetical protein
MTPKKNAVPIRDDAERNTAPIRDDAERNTAPIRDDAPLPPSCPTAFFTTVMPDCRRHVWHPEKLSNADWIPRACWRRRWDDAFMCFNRRHARLPQARLASREVVQRRLDPRSWLRQSWDDVHLKRRQSWDDVFLKRRQSWDGAEKKTVPFRDDVHLKGRRSLHDAEKKCRVDPGMASRLVAGRSAFCMRAVRL